jgi:asparagine synthetase B (glutamine-hydrolysing)
MFYKNNWLTWYYNEVAYGPKTTLDSKFDIKITPTITRQVKSYKEELLTNASLIRDSFNEPFDLMLSGGVDSEVILRCYLELKIPINVFVFRYENNYNLPDVTHALRICKELNVTPTVIDFNFVK